MISFCIPTDGLPQLFTHDGRPVPDCWHGQHMAIHLRLADGVHAACVNVKTESGYALYYWQASQVGTQADSDLLQLVDCFNEPRRRMRACLEFWRSFNAAAEDCFSFSRGQRAFYRRRANENRKRALDYAAQWKAAKAIWRKLTALRPR